jgi:hypothetical protein
MGSTPHQLDPCAGKEMKQRSPIEIEPLVSTAEACRKLNVGRTYMTKIKNEMGIAHSRKVFVSQIAEHIRKRRPSRHPNHLGATSDTNGARLSRRGQDIS